MRTLVQKFNNYAMIVLATLTALWTKTQTLTEYVTNESTSVRLFVQGQLDQFSSTLGNIVNFQVPAMIVSLRDNEIKPLIAAAKAQAIATANGYTDGLIAALNAAIAGLNFDIFGGRTKTEWEMYISNTVGTALTAEESRVKAMKEVSEVKVVKLADFTGDIAFGDIAFPAPTGENTTHLFKIQGALGATQTKRNLTGLPAAVNSSTTIEVDNGDEIFVAYKADGTVSIILYDDNEAAVVAAVLSTQATHGTHITDLESDVLALGLSFDAQAALVQTLLDQINGGGSYYYADGGGIGTGQLG